ncbi:MAG: S-layer homology domain-containing protein [Candidatus Gracilibacteria bacterium]|nr:S-layer homology domain-containing protein [Candidatus Gracilibacteria bacterium]
MLEEVRGSVQLLQKALMCSRGCLPLPLNFAFLAPGPINILGQVAGFDTGLPTFGISPSPFFIWPGGVPYEATTFRLYLSPTLTGGIGFSVCLGPWLLGQCMAFAVPVNQLGGESICDAAKEGLKSMMQGIHDAVGQVNAVSQQLAQGISQTGVIKSTAGRSNTADVESVIGVGLGGGVHNQGVTPLEGKVFLDPIPKIFVDWWDRQWEEVVNSLMDLPDITLRLPALGGAFGDEDYFKKLGDKVTGETFLNLQQIYDLINSLPVINLVPNVITVQIPWIEPGMLQRMEQSLYEFLYSFMLESIAFLHSFNLPCNITVTRDEVFSVLRKRIVDGQSTRTEADIVRIKNDIDVKGANLAEAEKELAQLSEEIGLGQETLDARRTYFEELWARQDRVNQLEKQFNDLEDQLYRAEQPKKIDDLFTVWVDVIAETVSFWQMQLAGFKEATVSDALNRETADAIRSCVALEVGVNISADVKGFVDGIQKNLQMLQVWKRFPRELAKYLNALEFYIGQITKMVDQLTSIALKWWSEFEKKLDLWLDAISSFQEFIALIKAILDILKGYSKRCGLCTSDRLTLKGLLMQIFFGVIPKFPIIDFPSWPDIQLDFSDVKLGADVMVPVFDVKAIDLRWPQLPQIKLPRFDNLKIDLSGKLSADFSVKLPDIPLVIPAPPDLPPLPALPDLPQINLPNLPPAPEVPQVLEQLLPFMKIIQTILDIWCLVNKSLVPFEEKSLKSQIENLTNRSGQLIIPLDLLLTIDVIPGDLIPDVVPFDLINVASRFEAAASIDPLPGLQTTVDQQFNAPMNAFIQQINTWMQELANSSQPGLGALQEAAQGLVDQYQLDVNLQEEAGIQEDLDLDQEFKELLNYNELIDGRKADMVARNDQLKSNLDLFHESLIAITAQEPDEMMRELAAQDLNYANLAVGMKDDKDYKDDKDDKEGKRIVEKQLAFVNKPVMLAQIDESKTVFQDVQDELLNTVDAGLDGLNVAVVRNGEARRLQDYPLDDPAVLVWDDDVFVAYEGSVYLKSVDNSRRGAIPYTGSVLRENLQDLQRSKVHNLHAETVSSSQSGVGKSTVRWSWQDSGEKDLELTIWDSVAGAQRLDMNHTRFYLHEEPDFSADVFQLLSSGVDLQEGQTLQAQQELHLRIGSDLVVIPSGLQFMIPSLLLREVQVTGTGVIRLDNVNGQSWKWDLGEGVHLEMDGMAQMSFEGGQTVSVPRLDQRPFVTDLQGDVTGTIYQRVEVLSGEMVPAGELYALGELHLVNEVNGVEMTLPQGLVLRIAGNDRWRVESGRGELKISDELVSVQTSEGMVLFDDELLRGNYVVEDPRIEKEIEFSEEQQVFWHTIQSPFEVTLPTGNYYGRIRQTEGLRGYSPIVYAAASSPRIAQVQLIEGVEEIPISVYSSWSVDARDYVIGELSDESCLWGIDGVDELISGCVFHHPGFGTEGDRTLKLYIRNGDENVLAKTFRVSVLLPELVLDEQLLTQSRIIQLRTDPSVADVPIGIIGERAGVSDWIQSDPVMGTRVGDRYLSDASGVVQLAPFALESGVNIVKGGSDSIARLYPNGRLVLSADFLEDCQNDPLLDSDGFLKYRVSCLEDGTLAPQFEVRILPDLDTDVSIVEDFSDRERGVSIRSLQSGLDLVPLNHNDPLAPGGVQVKVKGGNVLMVLGADGKVELNQDSLLIREKAYTDPLEPLLWQVFDQQNVLVEVLIRAPNTNSIVDPVSRALVLGDSDDDGILDRWEQVYGLDDPNEDFDGDGLTNLQEFQTATNPTVRDTDGDGLSDGEEVDPLSPESVQKKVSFEDVADSNPSFEAIQTLANLGFIQGYDDGSFRPDQPVTRAEALKIIMSVIRCENCQFPLQSTIAEYDPTQEGLDYFEQFHGGVFDSDFDPLKMFAFSENALQSRDDQIRTYFDVQMSDWYYYCVEIATKLGLVHGYRGFENGKNALGTFVPGRDVNIAELMKMVIEAVGDKGKQSSRVFGVSEGWWNDSSNNYLATAEEDLGLLLDDSRYGDPLQQATRAEVAYAAWKVLKSNEDFDFDEDGVANKGDQCPCKATNVEAVEAQGCPLDLAPYGPVSPQGGVSSVSPRGTRELFAGVEITQYCPCLVLVPADLYDGSSFFGVITGTGENSDRVYRRSNTVAAKGEEGRNEEMKKGRMKDRKVCKVCNDCMMYKKIVHISLVVILIFASIAQVQAAATPDDCKEAAVEALDQVMGTPPRLGGYLQRLSNLMSTNVATYHLIDEVEQLARDADVETRGICRELEKVKDSQNSDGGLDPVFAAAYGLQACNELDAPPDAQTRLQIILLCRDKSEKRMDAFLGQLQGYLMKQAVRTSMDPLVVRMRSLNERIVVLLQEYQRVVNNFFTFSFRLGDTISGEVDGGEFGVWSWVETHSYASVRGELGVKGWWVCVGRDVLAKRLYVGLKVERRVRRSVIINYQFSIKDECPDKIQIIADSSIFFTYTESVGGGESLCCASRSSGRLSLCGQLVSGVWRGTAREEGRRDWRRSGRKVFCHGRCGSFRRNRWTGGNKFECGNRDGLYEWLCGRCKKHHFTFVGSFRDKWTWAGVQELFCCFGKSYGAISWFSGGKNLRLLNS